VVVAAPGRRHCGSAGPLRGHLRRVPAPDLEPALPLASTITVITDSSGTATAGIAVNANAPTQVASIRATDVTSGNQLTGQFLIQQVTDGSQILSVILHRHRDHRWPVTHRMLDGRLCGLSHLRRYAAL
jgi:hypothetical protein